MCLGSYVVWEGFVALSIVVFFFFQAEDGIRDVAVTGVQTCALPICERREPEHRLLGGLLLQANLDGAAAGSAARPNRAEQERGERRRGRQSSPGGSDRKSVV